MRSPVHSHQVVAVVALLLACGKARYKEERARVVVDSAGPARSSSGQDVIRVVAHRADCPSSIERFEVAAGRPSATCLAALAPASTVERVLAHYEFPLITCGGKDKPIERRLGTCSLDDAVLELGSTAGCAPSPAR